MIVINQKRIKIILSCILISLFVFTAKTYNEQNKNDGGENIQTTATPASRKTIIIDAGHGKPDERCTK